MNDYPCDNCDRECDGWDMQYCCTLCFYNNEHPDCENCDPWDI